MLEKFNFTCKVYPRWSDMDELGHINNAVFLSYFEEARIAYFTQAVDWRWSENKFILARVEVDYHQPLFYKDTINCHIRISKLGSKSFDFEYMLINQKEQLIAQARSIQVMFDFKKNVSYPISERLKKIVTEFEIGLK